MLRFILAVLQVISLMLFDGTQAYVIRVNEKATGPVYEGWGTSGAWWAQMVGNTPNDEWVAKILFDDKEGLGLDIYRYNIGAGEAENPNSRIWGRSQKTESFYKHNEQTGEYEFDFSRDANARRMMDLAVKYGASEIVLFCNSPHFSMTRSGQASGGLSAGESNLPRENYREFVEYVLAVADRFVAEGYPVKYVSPINEPQWGWGGDWVRQEGCHYTQEEAVELLELFAVTMKERHTPYKLSMPETGQIIDFSWQDILFKSAVLREYCDTYSGHSYWLDGNKTEKTKAGLRFRFLFPGKRFVMSEWSELPCKLDADSVESALYMANTIIEDLTLLNAVSWQTWVAVNTANLSEGNLLSDGLLRANSDFTQLACNKRYYAFRQFTSFIKPGMKRSGTIVSPGFPGDVEKIAFRADGETVVVLLNNADEYRNIEFAGSYGDMRIYVTDAHMNFQEVRAGVFKRDVRLSPQSITTVVLNNAPGC